MPSVVSSKIPSVKLIMLGEQGSGKTGATVSLICAGYQVRVLDIDQGQQTLINLLTNENYPYAKIIRDKGINLATAYNYIPIDCPMVSRSMEGKEMYGKVLIPASGNSFSRAIAAIDSWKDKELNLDFGSVNTWDENCVLIIDSLSTLGDYALFLVQAMNGRLGAAPTEKTNRMDINSASDQLKRLMLWLHADSVRCNVVLITHIKWVEDSYQKALINQDGRQDQAKTLVPFGCPMTIGTAFASTVGKYTNNIFNVKKTGSGGNISRKIYTVGLDGIVAKSATFLKESYPQDTGLAAIFSAFRGGIEPDMNYKAPEVKKPPEIKSQVALKTNPTLRRGLPPPSLVHKEKAQELESNVTEIPEKIDG